MLHFLTADFLLHHEIGHTAVRDRRFDPFVSERVHDALGSLGEIQLDDQHRLILREEAEADLFGLNCCFSRYAPGMSERHLREYLDFAARFVIAINLFYAVSDDIHRLNVDGSHGGSSIETAFEIASHRLAIMSAHIESFLLGEDTAPCAPSDEFLGLDDPSMLFDAFMAAGPAMTECTHEDLRHASQIIDLGLQAGGDFDAIIGGYRKTWVLGDDPVATLREDCGTSFLV